MAKYTELLSEYLENGGELPAVFDTIDGFKDLFIGHFIAHEIGFETPVLFSIRLETTANLVVPLYAQKLQILEDSITKLKDPKRTNTRNGSYTRVRTGATERAYGEERNKNYDLPINWTNAAAEPSIPTTAEKREARTDTETYNAITDKETYENFSDVQSGETTGELLSKIEALTAEQGNIKRELLNEFNSLFMGIY